MKLGILFPCYRDVVDTKAWSGWADDDVKFYICEDVTHNNDRIFLPNFQLIFRDNRHLYKAGALNNAIDTILKSGEEYDYLMFFDGDHIPVASLDKIKSNLHDEVVQFFFDDGLPRRTAIDTATYSGRYHANWNNYNRDFSNLTGSAMAIKFDLFKQGLRFPGSITEDYALTMELLKIGKEVTVVPIVASIGRAPRNVKEFARQQERWAEGTVRDLRKYWRKVEVGWTQRLDMLLHANLYLQGFWIVTSIILVMIEGFNYIGLSLFLLQGATYYYTMRKSPLKHWPKLLILNYMMSVYQVRAFLKGLFFKNGFFHRTDKVTL